MTPVDASMLLERFADVPISAVADHALARSLTDPQGAPIGAATINHARLTLGLDTLDESGDKRCADGWRSAPSHDHEHQHTHLAEYAPLPAHQQTDNPDPSEVAPLLLRAVQLGNETRHVAPELQAAVGIEWLDQTLLPLVNELSRLQPPAGLEQRHELLIGRLNDIIKAKITLRNIARTLRALIHSAPGPERDSAYNSLCSAAERVNSQLQELLHAYTEQALPTYRRDVQKEHDRLERERRRRLERPLHPDMDQAVQAALADAAQVTQLSELRHNQRHDDLHMPTADWVDRDLTRQSELPDARQFDMLLDAIESSVDDGERDILLRSAQGLASSYQVDYEQRSRLMELLINAEIGSDGTYVSYD